MNSLPWRVVGASVQGTAHRERDIPCQDAHAFRLFAGGELVVAVADGAGSAPRADLGAKAAVSAAVGALELALEEAQPADEAGWQQLILAAFAEAREALAVLAESEGVPVKTLATTLACAVVADGHLVLGQIGDGVAVAEAADGSLFATIRPQRGEYANEAYFLTMPDALKYVETQLYSQPIRALALSTDGLLRLALQLPGYEPHVPFFTPLLAFLARAEDEQAAEAQLAAFLAGERVCARTDDDKTLVLAVRTEATSD